MGDRAHFQRTTWQHGSRLTLLSNKKSDDDVVSSFTYAVDKTGNRTKLTLSNGDYAEYVYDQTYQLTREHRKDSQNATLYYNNFFYDPAGNRTRLEYNDGTSTTTTSYLYNTADQLTRETTGQTVTSYLYDANGNLTKKDDGTNVEAYGYDFRNLMTDYDGPGSTNDTTYRYDALGRRITKDVNGTKTAYVHDGLDTVAEYNGSNQLQRTYVTPGRAANLSLTSSSVTYYYLADGSGSIRELTDGNQATQNRYDYYAFGGRYGQLTENVSQPYGFRGMVLDAESGYYRGSLYDPRTGRRLGGEPYNPLWTPFFGPRTVFGRALRQPPEARPEPTTPNKLCCTDWRAPYEDPPYNGDVNLAIAKWLADNAWWAADETLDRSHARDLASAGGFNPVDLSALGTELSAQYGLTSHALGAAGTGLTNLSARQSAMWQAAAETYTRAGTARNALAASQAWDAAEGVGIQVEVLAGRVGQVEPLAQQFTGLLGWAQSILTIPLTVEKKAFLLRATEQVMQARCAKWYRASRNQKGQGWCCPNGGDLIDDLTVTKGPHFWQAAGRF